MRTLGTLEQIKAVRSLGRYKEQKQSLSTDIILIASLIKLFTIRFFFPLFVTSMFHKNVFMVFAFVFLELEQNSIFAASHLSVSQNVSRSKHS